MQPISKLFGAVTCVFPLALCVCFFMFIKGYIALLECSAVRTMATCSHTCTSVTKQYTSAAIIYASIGLHIALSQQLLSFLFIICACICVQRKIRRQTTTSAEAAIMKMTRRMKTRGSFSVFITDCKMDSI